MCIQKSQWNVYSYLTNELDKSPTSATAAPTTATFRQPNRLVNTLTMGEQKKIIPMDREPTQAVEKIKNRTVNLIWQISLHDKITYSAIITSFKGTQKEIL